jgi:cytoskeletal protein RodZ
MPVDSLSGRARLLVIAAFVLSAALFGTAAVAYVLASRDDDEVAGPKVHPTVILPTQEPTASPSPTTSPTPSPTPKASPTASPSPAAVVTPSRSASPRPRATSAAPKPSATKPTAKEGLFASAALDRATGGTTGESYKVTAHATDGDGVIYLKSINWGDGTVSTLNQRGTACSPAAKAPADCRNYAVSHVYTKPGKHKITLTFVSGAETQQLYLDAEVSAAPSASPSPTA